MYQLVSQKRHPKHPIRLFRPDNAIEMLTAIELEKLDIEKEQIRIKPLKSYNYHPLLKFIFQQAAYLANVFLSRNGTPPANAYLQVRLTILSDLRNGCIC